MWRIRHNLNQDSLFQNMFAFYILQNGHLLDGYLVEFLEAFLIASNSMLLKSELCKFFPYAEVRNGIFTAHPVLNNDICSIAVVAGFHHVCQTNIILIVQTEDDLYFRVVNIDFAYCHYFSIIYFLPYAIGRFCCNYSMISQWPSLQLSADVSIFLVLSSTQLKSAAKLLKIFEIHKDFSRKMQIHLYFVLQSLVICTNVRM